MPRYKALPFIERGDIAWMIYDYHSKRMVVKPLHRKVAYTLARVMNVADLTLPVRYYGGKP